MGVPLARSSVITTIYHYFPASTVACVYSAWALVSQFWQRVISLWLHSADVLLTFLISFAVDLAVGLDTSNSAPSTLFLTLHFCNDGKNSRMLSSGSQQWIMTYKCVITDTVFCNFNIIFVKLIGLLKDRELSKFLVLWTGSKLWHFTYFCLFIFYSLS